jgi:hypothetical protein
MSDDSQQYVSEYTKKTMQQFGWVVGEPIPDSISDLLAGIHARTPASKVPGLYVDIASMTDDDISAVKAALAGAKVSAAQAKRNNEVDAATAGLDENTRALYAKLTEQNATPQIIDDRAAAAPAEAGKESQPESPTTVTEEPAPLALISDPPPAICPRCTWDMRMAFETTVTDTDKEVFVAVTLGNERFKKLFSLLGGKYVVTFRSLFAEENTKIHHQLLLDQKEDPTQFLSDTEWFLRMFEYRMACSIETIIVGGKPTTIVPELGDITAETELPNKSDDKTKTPLVRLREYVVVNTLKNEVTRRMVGNEFRTFQRLCETLEAMALEPSFW